MDESTKKATMGSVTEDNVMGTPTLTGQADDTMGTPAPEAPQGDETMGTPNVGSLFATTARLCEDNIRPLNPPKPAKPPAPSDIPILEIAKKPPAGLIFDVEANTVKRRVTKKQDPKIAKAIETLTNAQGEETRPATRLSEAPPVDKSEGRDEGVGRPRGNSV